MDFSWSAAIGIALVVALGLTAYLWASRKMRYMAEVIEAREQALEKVSDENIRYEQLMERQILMQLQVHQLSQPEFSAQTVTLRDLMQMLYIKDTPLFIKVIEALVKRKKLTTDGEIVKLTE